MHFFDPQYEPQLNDHNGDLSKRWYILFKIWDTDKQDFVFKQYKDLNKYKTLAARRKAAKEKIQEIKAIIEQGYTAGKAKASLKEYDIRKLTFRQAIDYFLNVKNNADLDGDRFMLNPKWNEKGSSISYGSFKNYRNYRNKVVDWIAKNNLDGIRLLEINKATAYNFFEFIGENKELYNKTFNHYLAFLRSIFTFFNVRSEIWA